MAITINVNLDEILAALKNDLDFTGNADKYIKVNATADGFEFAAVSVGSTWGSITGTLSDQTDLQSALDLKANLAGASFTGDVSVTTSGSGDTLQLTNSGSGTTLNILNSGSGDFLAIDTNKLVVSNNGNLAVDTNTLFVDATNNRVGIGTATPTYTLHASGTTSDQVSPISFVENLGNSLYVPTQVLHAPNITNNRNVYFSIGKSASTRNRINWLYYHNSDGSTSNRMDFTFFGVNTLFHILADGSFGMNTLSPTATLHVLSNSVSKVGAIIQAAAGQTANLQEWKDSAGNVLASIGSAGKLSIGATGGLRYTPNATRYTDFSGLNLGGGIYLSFPTTGNDSFVSYVGGSAISNIYMYWNSQGNINTRGSILLGAADGAATFAGAVSSAQLEVRSTTKGFLPPRMTGAQVEAISTPAEGLIAYATNAGAGDVTAKGLYIYNGTNWVSL